MIDATLVLADWLSQGLPPPPDPTIPNSQSGLRPLHSISFTVQQDSDTSI